MHLEWSIIGSTTCLSRHPARDFKETKSHGVARSVSGSDKDWSRAQSLLGSR